MASFLRAPFVYSGGKSRIANLVWNELGDPANYLEPFCGSAAVLLARPTAHVGRREIIGDRNGYVANAWRSIQFAPEETARHAWWPTIHADLTARHRWLVRWGRDGGLQKLMDDPYYYDCRVAGFWIWGISNWLSNSDFCQDAFRPADENRMPADWAPAVHPSAGGLGGANVHRRTPVHLPGDSVPFVLFHDGGQGVQSSRIDTPAAAARSPEPEPDALSEFLREQDRWLPWFVQLSRRLARCHILARPWESICLSRSVSGDFDNRSVGVFLDPPYRTGSRATDLYAADDDGAVFDAFWEWAQTAGQKPNFRIALCALEGDFEPTLPDGWTVHYWRNSGGMGGGGTAGKAREAVLFSPHCVGQQVQQSQLL